jgi:hypothetical protein
MNFRRQIGNMKTDKTKKAQGSVGLTSAASSPTARMIEGIARGPVGHSGPNQAARKGGSARPVRGLEAVVGWWFSCFCCARAKVCGGSGGYVMLVLALGLLATRYRARLAKGGKASLHYPPGA